MLRWPPMPASIDNNDLALTPACQARQIDALAGADHVGAPDRAPVGRADPAIGARRSIVAPGDSREGVALAYDVPARQADSPAGGPAGGRCRVRRRSVVGAATFAVPGPAAALASATRLFSVAFATAAAFRASVAALACWRLVSAVCAASTAALAAAARFTSAARAAWRAASASAARLASAAAFASAARLVWSACLASFASATRFASAAAFASAALASAVRFVSAACFASAAFLASSAALASAAVFASAARFASATRFASAAIASAARFASVAFLASSAALASARRLTSAASAADFARPSWPPLLLSCPQPACWHRQPSWPPRPSCRPPASPLRPWRRPPSWPPPPLSRPRPVSHPWPSWPPPRPWRPRPAWLQQLWRRRPSSRFARRPSRLGGLVSARFPGRFLPRPRPLASARFVGLGPARFCQAALFGRLLGIRCRGRSRFGRRLNLRGVSLVRLRHAGGSLLLRIRHGVPRTRRRLPASEHTHQCLEFAARALEPAQRWRRALVVRLGRHSRYRA